MVVSVGHHNVSGVAANSIVNGVVDNCCSGKSCHSPGRRPSTPPAPGWGGPASVPAVVPGPRYSPSGPCPAGTNVDIIDIDSAVPVAVYIPVYIPVYVPVYIAVYISIGVSVYVAVEVAIAIAVGHPVTSLASAW
ncbi:CxxxxCH/CxxCH domain-containing protein [Cyanobium sp. To12R1]|uniref:CxxxxCH/CxxCH domain-containing protein n=1 Tax=Cyanobium sp. To12R1 TaxID=2823723 RepID=UPI000E3C24B8|nr:CxxxxCH/CxxCH domain-containing protein [Cyanobium sp. To12R1]